MKKKVGWVGRRARRGEEACYEGQLSALENERKGMSPREHRGGMRCGRMAKGGTGEGGKAMILGIWC